MQPVRTLFRIGIVAVSLVDSMPTSTAQGISDEPVNRNDAIAEMLQAVSHSTAGTVFGCG